PPDSQRTQAGVAIGFIDDQHHPPSRPDTGEELAELLKHGLRVQMLIVEQSLPAAAGAGDGGSPRRSLSHAGGMTMTAAGHRQSHHRQRFEQMPVKLRKQIEL